VVREPGAGLPERRRLGEAVLHPAAVEDLRSRDRRKQAGEPRLVRDHMPDEQALLPFRRELRPVAGHGHVELELPAFDEQEEANGDETLGTGEDRDERVVLP
jgi:hypothetical protein